MVRPIYLLTDFGHQDIYVGVMKSVIHQIAPKHPIIDLCHGVPAQSILSGSYQLKAAIPYLPAASVIIVVVDPGVGSQRRAIALELDTGHFLVGPDNGLFSDLADQFGVKGLVNIGESPFNLSQSSHTFHGRDIFAPNGAELARKGRLKDLGPLELKPKLVSQDGVVLRIESRVWRGTVLHIDHFGNVITNIENLAGNLDEGLFSVLGHHFQGARTFSDGRLGDYLLYQGSSGHLEMGANGGNLARDLDIQIGDHLDILLLDS
ncbi:SAM hydrolase/SAM-dependent halogenase family protein [Pseudobacteriovorax antillogorgiicola]|uniref:S-adenosyl-l-methionine hydroxide adenosyltransferase n=1 Tax=Pseudobacteriovorax antillogorgiicola TaxID=1513793 RepID=A0A1Y6CJQ9_9BACT|nr:SAM-dependent chlorinase/fluorinase [Pseudobacteriovorax antillogorgiicola]TCS47965.1 hypothetical protein EDD56_11976 [Pseudobacteriovorax antillogorgiicola]SMF58202.1 hypothetical protein SAMN06296036_11977 [Pseudobacteriovorax antillogorgiicola]